MNYCSIGVVYEEIIYLVMDNKEGHRKNEAVLDYSEYLAVNYNIVVHCKFSTVPQNKHDWPWVMYDCAIIFQNIPPPQHQTT